MKRYNDGWDGIGRSGRIDKRKLVAEVKRRGGTIEDDSGGRFNVLQLVAPEGMLWSEGVMLIRVEWRKGEPSESACRDAWERIGRQTFRPMTEEEKPMYACD